MNSQNGIKKEGKNSRTNKMVWQLPELTELDINESTLNVTKVPGVTLDDGSDVSFSDYNS